MEWIFFPKSECQPIIFKPNHEKVSLQNILAIRMLQLFLLNCSGKSVITFNSKKPNNWFYFISVSFLHLIHYWPFKTVLLFCRNNCTISRIGRGYIYLLEVAVYILLRCCCSFSVYSCKISFGSTLSQFY